MFQPTPQNYGIVIGMYKSGSSLDEIKDSVGCSMSTVQRYIRKYNTGGLENLKDGRYRNGPRRKTTPEEDQAIVAEASRAKSNPATIIGPALGIPAATPWIVRNRVIEAELKSQVAADKTILKDAEHEGTQVALCREHVPVTEELWSTVFHTDEKNNNEKTVKEYEEYKSRIYPKRKLKGESLAPPAKRRKSPDQEKADKLILRYVASTGKPLSTVDDIQFVELVSGLCRLKTEVTCPTRENLKTKITNEYQEMIDEIKADILNTEYVCTTADIWSSCGPSYLGMTIHWVDENFERSSRAIACRRINGSHNYLAITKTIKEIHDEFRLDRNKLVCTLTNNGTNYSSTFKQFNYKPHKNCDEDDATGETAFHEIPNLIPEPESSSQEEFHPLPKQMRCCSRTLSLIVTDDVEKAAEEDQLYGKTYETAMTKCSDLWNKVGRSSGKVSDIYENIAGSAPKIPCPTSLNSLYDSIAALLEVEDKLPEICHALDTPAFVTQDIEFLQEYVRCLKPIAYCLDQMRDENDVFLGDALPLILTMRYNMDRIDEEKALKYCQPLKECLLKSVNIRFADMLDFDNFENDFIIASVSHPKWKLGWLSMIENGPKTDHIRNIVSNAMKKTSIVPSNVKQEISNDEEDTQANFFSFAETPVFDKIWDSHYHTEMEFMQYLTDEKESLKMLNNYENVKRLFLKFNTAIPSSASVERIFNFDELILTPRSTCSHDDAFERCALLKANSRLK